MIQRKAAIDEANVQSDGGSDNDGDENAPPENSPGQHNPEMQNVARKRSRIDAAMNGLAQAMIQRGNNSSFSEQIVLMEAKREEREMRWRQDQMEREAKRERRRVEREEEEA